jgi:hypothetical protein
MTKPLKIAILAILATFSTAKASTVDLLAAIAHVESNGDTNKIGDNGKAIGIFQIHRDYWYDATHNGSGTQLIDGKYEDCRDAKYAEKIVVAYWTRYAPAALKVNDCETLARVHNGGPKGASIKVTLKYWQKVESQLKEQK